MDHVRPMQWFVIGLCVAAATGIASAEAPSTEGHTRVGRVALGLGESWIKGKVQGRTHQLSLGVRVTERDWITATYARGGDLESDYAFDSDLEFFYEVGVHASRMQCHRDTPLCGVLGAGIGYQRMGISGIDDDPSSGASIFYVDTSAPYGELRVALRAAYEHVWLEGAVAMRLYGSDGLGRLGERDSYLAGVAVYLLP